MTIPEGFSPFRPKGGPRRRLIAIAIFALVLAAAAATTWYLTRHGGPADDDRHAWSIVHEPALHLAWSARRRCVPPSVALPRYSPLVPNCRSPASPRPGRM